MATVDSLKSLLLEPCEGMKGLIAEGDEHAKENYDDDDLRDAMIIGSAQRVEHYEIAGYGTAIAHARLLGLEDVVDLLEATLAEEKAADRKLTEVAETVVNLEAAADDEEADQPVRRQTTRRRNVSNGSATAADRNRGSARTRSHSRSPRHWRSRQPGVDRRLTAVTYTEGTG